MRINISDEEDYPGQFNLWQANCNRSLQGKAGQASLRELRDALLALPEKRLIANELKDADGEVCAIGAVMKYRGITETKADPEEMEEVGVELGIPRPVAWKIVYENDEQIDGHFENVPGPTKWGHPLRAFIPVTPEERYRQMLAWVEKQIKQASGGEAARQIGGV